MIPNRERQSFLMVLSAPFLLLAMVAGGVAAESPAVSVESMGSQLTLRVVEPSDLSAVLETLCRHVQARCDGLSAAADAPVQPVTITGDWAGVLRQLFEGSGLNYIALAPTREQPGRLLVAARSAAPVELAPEAGRESRRVVEEADRRTDELPRALLERGMRAQEDSASEPAPAPVATVPFVAPPGTVALPFPGADNFPILAPVLNTPAGLTPNPFPDANGNAINFPAAGQPVVGSPFPGLNGQPVSTSPAPPGQSPNPFGTGAPPR